MKPVSVYGRQQVLTSTNNEDFVRCQMTFGQRRHSAGRLISLLTLLIAYLGTPPCAHAATRSRQLQLRQSSVASPAAASPAASPGAAPAPAPQAAQPDAAAQNASATAEATTSAAPEAVVGAPAAAVATTPPPPVAQVIETTKIPYMMRNETHQESDLETLKRPDLMEGVRTATDETAVGAAVDTVIDVLNTADIAPLAPMDDLVPNIEPANKSVVPEHKMRRVKHVKCLEELHEFPESDCYKEMSAPAPSPVFAMSPAAATGELNNTSTAPPTTTQAPLRNKLAEEPGFGLHSAQAKAEAQSYD